jgi:hypothetical protein
LFQSGRFRNVEKIIGGRSGDHLLALDVLFALIFDITVHLTIHLISEIKLCGTIDICIFL